MIRDEVVYTPSELKYKVYIIDEVHMLSINAFNGLLKTLEEPPSYVVFILATTEMHKLPSTIISRCQRFDFRKISIDNIVKRLRIIADNEKTDASDDALRIIARLAAGGMRDAVSLFELCSGAGKSIDTALVCDMLGVSSKDILFSLVRAIKEKNYDYIFSSIRDVENSSKDIAVFWQELIAFYRDMLVSKTLKNSAEYLELSESELVSVRELISDMTSAEIIRQSKILDSALAVMQRAGSYKRNIAEMTLVRLCDSTLDLSSDAMLARISELESRVMRLNAQISDVASGAVSVTVQHVQQPENTPQISIDDDIELTEEKNTHRKIQKEPEFEELVTSTQRVDLRYWDEVVESVKNTNPSVKGFIDSSEGYKNGDGEFTVVLDSDMAVKMLSREKVRGAIADAISFYEGKRVSDAQLNFVADSNQKRKKSPIDDLM